VIIRVIRVIRIIKEIRVVLMFFGVLELYLWFFALFL
jgi:hypothetical protein